MKTNNRLKYTSVVAGLTAFIASLGVTDAQAAPQYVRTVRIQSGGIGSQYCIGGSRSDSLAALWSCAATTARYDWEIWTSEISGYYYLVNAGNGKCLSRKSSSNKIRQYGFSEDPCRQSDYRLWAFHGYDPLTSATGVGRIFLRHPTRGGCLSSGNGNRLTIQPCNYAPNPSYPVLFRTFLFNRPGPIGHSLAPSSEEMRLAAN